MDLIDAGEQQLPRLMLEFANLFGKAPRKISRLERANFRAGLRRKLARLLPRFKDLESLGAEATSVDHQDRLKTVLRGIVIEMLATPRIRRSDDVESFRLDSHFYVSRPRHATAKSDLNQKVKSITAIPKSMPLSPPQLSFSNIHRPSSTSPCTSSASTAS